MDQSIIDLHKKLRETREIERAIEREEERDKLLKETAVLSRGKLNIEEASEYLGISVSTIHKLTMKRDISFLKVGKRYLFDPETLVKEFNDRGTFSRINTK